MNSVTIYGQVASEPMYEVQARSRVLDFTIVVKRPSSKPGGAGADFIPVRLWNQQADSLKDMIRYGDSILVQGRLRVDRKGTCTVSAHDSWLIGKAIG